MQFYASQVSQPDQRRIFGRQHVIDLIFLLLIAKLDVFEPHWRPFRAILLEESLVIHSVRPTHQCKRPSFDVTKNCGSDLQVVLDQLSLDYAVEREQNLCEVRDLYLSLPNLGDCAA